MITGSSTTQTAKGVAIGLQRMPSSSHPLIAISRRTAGVRPRGSHACGFYWTEGNIGLGWAVDSVPPLKGASALHIPSPPAIWFPRRRLIAVPAIEDAERLKLSLPGDGRVRWGSARYSQALEDDGHL